MENKKANKKGQITIFVIIALILVVGIALIYTLISGPGAGISYSKNPRAAVELCIRDSVEEAAQLIAENGGQLEIDSSMPSIIYDGKSRAFLCHTQNNKELCSGTEPMLAKKIGDGIKDYIAPTVASCFKNLENEFKKYNYQAGETEIDVEILPGNILLKINKEVFYNKGEGQESLNNFDVKLNSPMFEFIRIANRVINDEVNCKCGTDTCDADTLKISLDNPRFEIKKFTTGGNEEIYRIKETLTKKEFVFAVRNCINILV